MEKYFITIDDIYSNHIIDLTVLVKWLDENNIKYKWFIDINNYILNDIRSQSFMLEWDLMCGVIQDRNILEIFNKSDMMLFKLVWG